MCTRRGILQRGLTLIELIIFIVVVGAALGGVLAAFNVAVRWSADPLIHKQMVAVAEALMSEITLHPFTYCDPNDTNALYANGASTAAGNCAAAATVEGLGSEAGETRYSNATPFDNVNDYNGFTMNAGIRDLTNTAIPALAGYNASVTITQVGGGAGSLAGLAADAALQIVVTVTHGNDSFSLTGYRFRHSPNAAG